jgi:bifunctional UDP-N-acetylglucosamine pyrophosphorylase/glucosamine-1-phosphate N-acetyltransferase
MKTTAIVLAAGLGTRMKSALPKVMHPLGGRPMLAHLLASAGAVFDRIVVVIGPGMEQVAAIAAPHAVVVQHERRGTAHAALQARGMFGDGEVVVLYGDNPLITPATMRRLIMHRRDSGAGLALLAMRPADPGRYGRVVEKAGTVVRIVEYADATEDERANGLCNAGVMAAEAGAFGDWLSRIRDANAKGEFYLTDAVAIAHADGARVVALEAPEDELRGVNSRAELAHAEAVLQSMLRCDAMEKGVTLVAPGTVFLSADTVIEPDVVVEPNVVFGPGVHVSTGARIRAFSHLEGCRVATGAVIGPYARLRPGAVVGEDAHVGNFVELKATTLGRGAKANHLAYLGDASVGAGSNIGAGTITCNYDGFAKHRTLIGDRVFVGSDAVLVAPVSIGDGALIAAGSVITDDVAADALALGRARQVDKPDGAARFRAAKGD